MLQMAPDYDNLTLMQKVEVFGYALDNTTGQDLYRVLWLKSKSSEAWLDRRTNYTRSLGVMSMVGYILGLGDRHPSNLMLHRITGKIIHIDFGDCFEVAMHREKYPEKVPFRLTRMLTYAMEVSQIEGSFRTTCEAVMKVLRENKESLMAVLEAFMHDPLMHWRLGVKEESPVPSPASTHNPSSAPSTPNLIAPVMSAMPDSSNPPPQPALARRRMSVAGGPGVTLAQNPEQQKMQLAALQAQAAAAPGGAGPPAGGVPAGRGAAGEHAEQQNQRAIQVLERVKAKLTGTDFGKGEELEVARQVARLIDQATNLENLCQHYIGWCSFW